MDRRSQLNVGKLIVPGALGWQVWKCGHRSLPSFVENVQGSISKQSGISVFYIPTIHFHCSLLKVLDSGDEVLRSAVSLKLEEMGVFTPHQEPTLCFRILGKELGKALIQAISFNENVLPLPDLPASRRWVPSPFAYSFEPYSLSIWEENQHWCVSVSDAHSSIYFQTLSTCEVNEVLSCELDCILLQLSASIPSLLCSKINLYVPSDPTRTAYLTQRMGIVAQVMQLPPPGFPHESIPDILPRKVLLTRKQAKRKSLQKKWVATAALVYLLILIGLALHLFSENEKVRSLREEVAQHADEVQSLKNTAVKWRALEECFETEHYPMNILLKITRHLPDEGMRITIFEKKDRKVSISGLSSKAQNIFAFLDKIKADPALAAYKWTLPQPRLLKDDTAQFQLEGSW